ncbi:uncharacterized protein LOC143037816 [Oratosquilla oratoria]|uniref:uncharacterized protein LOC143037816 n=1 Tax=Oratosquilla oratoria TaxID=337810 RepID=UPI003F760C53
MAKQSDFKATEFVGNPEIQEFKETNICKDDLKYIAKTFNISFKPDLRKDELRALILAHLGDKDVLEASRSLQTSDPNLLLELEKQLDIQNNANSPKTKTDLLKYVKLIPTFPDSDPESFFREFESTALHFEIPKPDWVWLIKPKLSDKALKVCNNVDDNTNYDEVKVAILASYSISTEGYRQAFRSLNKLQYQTYHEFASEKLRGLKRWLKSASVNTFDELVNVIALEEFIRKIPYSIKMHLIDRGENDLIKAAQLADVFSLVHRSPTRERRVLQHNVKSNSGFKDGELVDQSNLKTNLTCSFCKRRGHHIKQCPDPKCKVSQTTAPSKPVAAILPVPTSKTADIFQPFRSLGAVSLEDGGEVHPIRIVRDTAAAQTVILKSSVPGIDSNYTGESVYLHDFNSQFPLRLARVHLSCGIVQGPVTVAVSEQPSLPIPDCSLLLGNDIAGGLVQTPAPIILSDTPLTHNPTDELEREQPNLFPSCAVTRSQKLKDTPTHSPLPPPSAIPQIFTEQSLLEAQQNDTTLTPLHSKVVPKEDILHPPSFYYHDNILMRLYRPPQLSDDDTWAECHQIVLPTSLRTPIMEVAHQGLSGHLGIRKTYLRLLNEFYWPGMKKDVAEFVKNCHPCQIVGKPNETIPPYPLQPIKVPFEPFSKLIIDIVGPLPKTKKGNQYILTTLSPTTRYPDAFPLKNISAKTVANTLTNLFTTFGIPEEIQSDRGSNFTSVLFAEVLKLLGIKQTLSTAYHPQSQGALERFHQTMKSMIRKFCCEEDRDWDEGLQFLLFAIRETPSESLGVSPFELLFGRKVRGPLKVIKDHLISLPSTKLVTVNNYITSLKSNLDKVRSFAKTNLAHAQSVMKTNFDSKALVREFKEGDLVLAYIPISGSPLGAKYHGPYKISKKLSDSNYIISTPDRRKATQHIHVNLIKPYKTTSPLLDYEKQVLAVNTVPNVMSRTPNNAMYINFDKILPNIDSHPTDNSHILGNLVPYLSHLTNEHDNNVTEIIHKYDSLFKDVSGICNIATHDVKLVPGSSPIRHNPYRIHPQKREQMRSEVNFLLDHGLASPSQSPWASPCLLVPKEGGQLRLCTDYRRVNSITVPDAYPLPRVDDLIDEVDAVLSRLCQANLTVKLSKTSFGKATVTYLGHEVGQGIVRPKTANISAVMEYPVPATRKALMRFLGIAGYYRRFCPNFAEAALPLTKLTSGSVPYKWTQNCQAAFEHLKAMLTRDPVLRSPDFTKPFVLHTDASDVAIGAVLLQENTDTLHPVAYFSAKLDVHQLNYSTVEKELLAIVAAIKKFECYLQPSIKPLKIYSDHNPLTFLHRNKTSNQRMLRWSLFLQPFNIDIHHITGSQNVLADTLSRI